MNVHGIETQAGISETLADIKAMSAADAQDAAPHAADDAMADGPTPAAAASPAKIQIITKSKGTDGDKCPDVALSSLTTDQQVRFDQVHARLKKKKETCTFLGQPHPQGPC